MSDYCARNVTSTIHYTHLTGLRAPFHKVLLPPLVSRTEDCRSRHPDSRLGTKVERSVIHTRFPLLQMGSPMGKHVSHGKAVQSSGFSTFAGDSPTGNVP